MVCFVHFDIEMCFAPQRRALFRHRNFQIWSVHGVLCTFWLGNVLRATTACTFSTSQLPKVVRSWCALYILTSKCASRHNGVHFFDIWTSKSGPRMVCFVHFDLEMCFAPQRRAIFHLSSGQLAPHPPLWRAYFSTLRSPKSLEKHSVSRLSYLFAHLHRLLTLSLLLFFLLIFLFSLPLPCSAFHLSILSEIWLLNFLRWSKWWVLFTRETNGEDWCSATLWGNPQMCLQMAIICALLLDVKADVPRGYDMIPPMPYRAHEIAWCVPFGGWWHTTFRWLYSFRHVYIHLFIYMYIYIYIVIKFQE